MFWLRWLLFVWLCCCWVYWLVVWCGGFLGYCRSLIVIWWCGLCWILVWFWFGGWFLVDRIGFVWWCWLILNWVLGRRSFDWCWYIGWGLVLVCRVCLWIMLSCLCWYCCGWLCCFFRWCCVVWLIDWVWLCWWLLLMFVCVWLCCLIIWCVC